MDIAQETSAELTSAYRDCRPNPESPKGRTLQAQGNNEAHARFWEIGKLRRTTGIGARSCCSCGLWGKAWLGTSQPLAYRDYSGVILHVEFSYLAHLLSAPTQNVADLLIGKA